MPFSRFASLPERPRETPSWNRELGFEWDHNLPTESHGGIRYIPALDLMMVVNSVGSVDFCDPVTMRIVKRLVFAANTNGILTASYVPSCHKIVVPIHENGSGTQIRVVDLKTGKTTVISGLNSACYSAAYCPVNDKVYVTAYNTPTVYVVDPWTEALHTTPTVSGTFGAITFGICFCPLNGKLYAASRTANNIYRIDPTTNAIDNTIASGNPYDGLFFADAIRKVMVVGTQGTAWKTLDPLNSDALAALGFGSTCSSGCSSPTTGRTILQMGNTAEMLDQSGASVCHMTEPSISPLYFGWNPVTEKFWATDPFVQLYVIEPIEMSTTRYRYGTYLRQRII